MAPTHSIIARKDNKLEASRAERSTLFIIFIFTVKKTFNFFFFFFFRNFFKKSYIRAFGTNKIFNCTKIIYWKKRNRTEFNEKLNTTELILQSTADIYFTNRWRANPHLFVVFFFLIKRTFGYIFYLIFLLINFRMFYVTVFMYSF